MHNFLTLGSWSFVFLWLVGCLLRLLRAYMFGFAHSFMQRGLATEHSLSIPSPIMNPSPCPTAIKPQRSLWFLEAHITFRGFFCSCFSSQKLSPGLPRWRSGLESACQCRGHGLTPWSRKIPRATEQLSPCTTTTEPAL